MRVNAAGALAIELAKAKVRCFGHDGVEIKANWLRRGDERKSRYLDPYGLSDKQLNAFVDDFYSNVLHADLALLAAVIDKEHMTELYKQKRWYPPAAAYEAVVQRANNEIFPEPESSFSVTMDDMTGKTPNGSEYTENLTKHHEQLKRTGSSLIKKPIDAMVGRLRFMNSRDSSLLQVADLIAYNVFRQFTDHGVEWETHGLPNLPTHSWFKKVAHKFRQDENGRIQGYGVVKFPIKSRVEWASDCGEVVARK